MFPRLRPKLAVCLSAITLVACPLLAGSGAEAAPALRANGLPPIGAEVPSSMTATNAQFQIGTALVSLDFQGGIKQRVEASATDPDHSVRLRTVGFRVAADLPGIGGHGDGPSIVTFEQSNIDTDPQSTFTLTQANPPTYEERDVITFTAAIERPGQATLVLHSKNPMILRGTTSSYPAKGDAYSLEQPVQLVEEGHPDTTVATLQSFPSKRGGL
ncbi:hypothetical protein ABZ934_29970 [Streptomyces sp. NPDC046557]|uniref:hypothetical protein n=1 Tax=Streptomyces sp. NPDC046557 TaxID=3155372 RepID=UPI0033E8DA6C